MRRDEVPNELSASAFEFFFWFSRFEFAMKENGYLKSHKVGTTAEPGWKDFVDKWQSEYVPSQAAIMLIALSPERHIVNEHQELAWKPVGLADCVSQLQKVVRLLKTVRNNLFHGGKHGGAGWSNPKRTQELLSAGLAVLDELAQLACLSEDYTQYY